MMRLVCPLPELTTTTACFQFGENPGDWAGILAHLAASQLFSETMEEGAFSYHQRVEMQAAVSGCPSLSINVYWTSVGHRNFTNAVSI